MERGRLQPKITIMKRKRFIVTSVSAALVGGPTDANEAGAAFEAWTAGDRKKALSLIPDSMMEEIYVFGTSAKIAARLREYEKAGITSSALQFVSYAKESAEKRKRIFEAMRELATNWR